jgi:hypothetical protein
LSFVCYEYAYGIEKYSPNVIIVPLNRTTLHSNENASIYANVTDKYGLIDKEKALLMYTVNNGTWQTTKMDLIDGTLSNGTYYGVITSPANKSSTIKYKLQFQDNLNYSYTSDEYKYNVTESKDDLPPEITNVRTSKKVYFPDQSALVKATISDGNGTGIKNVTLIYSIGSDPKNKTADMKLVKRSSTDNKENYEGYIPPTGINTHSNGSNTTVSYTIMAFDNAGNKGEKSKNYAINETGRVFPNSVNMSIRVDELDSRDLNSKLNISFIGENINKSKIHNDIPILVVNLDNVTSDEPISIWPEKKAVERSNVGVTLENSKVFNSTLFGTPRLFPFDSYNLNLIAEIPIPNATINDHQVKFSPAVNSSWNPHVTYSNTFNKTNPISKDLCGKTPPKFSDYGVCNNDGVTLKSISIIFKRNYTIHAILIPMLAIFFLLGSIFVLKSLSNELSNRLTLTLSIFAFVFTFSPIIDEMKPSNIFSLTIADFLIAILIVSTIAFSVSSVIAAVYGRTWIDKSMLIAMIIVILYYGYQFDFGGASAWWVFPVVILGVGYGFLLKIPWRKLSTLRPSIK